MSNARGRVVRLERQMGPVEVEESRAEMIHAFLVRAEAEPGNHSLQQRAIGVSQILAIARARAEALGTTGAGLEA